MKVLVLGAGKMGSFFIDLLSSDHETAVYDPDSQRLKFTYNCLRFSSLEEVDEFHPELVINAATVKNTIKAFKDILPHIDRKTIISDIASIKTGLKEFYDDAGHPYVSTHPMFGPTFANLHQLHEENAIVINEGDYLGRIFFKDLYGRLGLTIHEFSFEEHDKTMAYSLSIPFVSSFVFSAVMKPMAAPGTTFKRHLATARGVLGEDDFLLQEILFNPHTVNQVADIRNQLGILLEIIEKKDQEGMNRFLQKIRGNVRNAYKS